MITYRPTPEPADYQERQNFAGAMIVAAAMLVLAFWAWLLLPGFVPASPSAVRTFGAVVLAAAAYPAYLVPRYNLGVPRLFATVPSAAFLCGAAVLALSG